jgi:HSP20 family protein
MAIFRWLGENDFFSPLQKMQREMNNMLSTGRPGPGLTQRPGVYPALNIYDDGESFIVWAEVPGMEPKSIDITVSGDTLKLTGERTLPELGEGASYHRRERDFGHFSRALTLPEQVDNSRVVASYKNGILEILLPRAEQAKQRKIEIKTS